MLGLKLKTVAIFNNAHTAIKDLRFVVKALKTTSARWEDFGMAADVKDLERIKRQYRGE